MKKSFLLILLSLFLFSSGCKKYPDGPLISLRSRAERVANTWKVEKYLKNDIDQTADFLATKINYLEISTKEGSWSFSYTNSKDNKVKSGGGTWQFTNDDKQILRLDGGDAELLTILKLKEKEFWFWYIDSNDKKEFHLIPAK